MAVGPILGLINHFDIWFGREITGVRIAKISVTLFSALLRFSLFIGYHNDGREQANL